jgi:hypothetical protein
MCWPSTVVLCDWDHVAVGPPEWDLAQVFYTSARLGFPAPDDVEDFAAAYGWDPATGPAWPPWWPGREASGLSPYIRNAPPSHSPAASSPCASPRSRPATIPRAGTARLRAILTAPPAR